MPPQNRLAPKGLDLTSDFLLFTGDVGDHVVMINTKHIAMKDDLWRQWKHFHHTGWGEDRGSDLNESMAI